MKFYLMRHAEAEDGPRMDPTRGLTDTGKAQAKMMAKWLDRQVEKPELILESNMKRSHQTAKRLAKKLDAPIQRTPAIDPDSKPADALKAMRQFGKQAAVDSVIAVSHGPLVEEIMAAVTDGRSKQFHFAHASVAHFEDGVLHWIVTPNTVARDHGEQKKVVSDLEEAANGVIDCLEVAHDSPAWKRIDRAKAKFEARLERIVLAGLRKQRKGVEAVIRELMLREADQSDIDRILAGLQPFASVVAPGPLAAVLEAAALAGIDGMDIGIEGFIFKTPSPSVLAYLRSRALELIGRDVDETTVERLKNILLTGMETGQRFQDIIKAIRDAGAFSRQRAQTIAVTEIGNAYTEGTMRTAKDLAAEGLMMEKSWLPDGDPCEICEGNAAQDWIPIDEDFESGDDAPLAHPNCRCALLTRVVHE